MQALNLAMQRFFRKAYGIHSPFLYALMSDCVFEDQDSVLFRDIEMRRRWLRRCQQLIRVRDFGQGGRFAFFRGPGRSSYRAKAVKTIARSALQPPKYCRLLYRLASYRKAEYVLELGTSLGISAAYLARAIPGGRLVTLEGCPELSRIAREGFDQLAIGNAEVITGAFSETLPRVVNEQEKPDLVFIDGNHSGSALIGILDVLNPYLKTSSVLLIDDIRWSPSMWQAWKSIRDYEKVRLSLDLWKMGVLFFDDALSKEKHLIGF